MRNKKRIIVIILFLLFILPGTGFLAQSTTEEQWIVTREPTCTVNGERYKKNGPYTDVEEIPATGHTYYETLIPPTCEAPGERILLCSVCGDRKQEITGAALGHDYIDTLARPATCTTEGYHEATCSRCQAKITEPIAALGHHYSDWITDSEATTSQNGQRHRTCQNCGDTELETIAINAADGTISTQVVSKTIETASSPAITPLDVLVFTANLALLGVLGFLIYVDVYGILWVRRRRKKVRKDLQKKRSEGDKYEFI